MTWVTVGLVKDLLTAVIRLLARGWSGVWNPQGVQACGKTGCSLTTSLIWKCVQSALHRSTAKNNCNTNMSWFDWTTHQQSIMSITMGTRSPMLNSFARHIWLWADVHLQSLRAIHVPGKRSYVGVVTPSWGSGVWTRRLFRWFGTPMGRAEMDQFCVTRKTHFGRHFSESSQGTLARSTQPITSQSVLADPAELLSVISPTAATETLGLALGDSCNVLDCLQGVRDTILNALAPSTRLMLQ